MKQLTIQKKIILWFSAMLLIIVILISAMTFAIAGSVLNESIKERLHDIVYQNMAEIEYWNDLSSTEAEPGDQFLKYHDGWLEIDDDFCNIFEGISTALYDADGNLLYGNMPIKLSASGTLSYTNIEKIKYKGENYYVFDKALTVSGLEELWLRGVVSQNESTNILYNVVRLSFWLLPALAVLAILGGYIITRRSFLPVELLAKSAEEIGTGNDLSKRLDIGPGNDEIHMLANVFNDTFARLERNFEVEKQFTSDASHDLRTPLTLIEGYAEVMRDLPGENTPENMQVIIDETKRLSTLVNAVLDYSVSRSGQAAPQVTRFNLTAAIREIMTRYAKLTEQDGYHIIFDPDRDAFVTADEIKVGQVIYNLINNALTYTGSDKTVSVLQTVRDGRVKIEVRDSGEGIAPEDLPYIWGRYYRGDRPHKRAAIGTGLGLNIVKGILDSHGLAYGVESEKEKGSTFWFVLPEA